ncbi:MAG: MSCRAMM family protein [Thermoleophilia bacterium]
MVGALLLLLATLVAGMLIVQISLSGPDDTAAIGGPIVDQAGTIGSESTTTPPQGSGAGAAGGPTGAGNSELAGLTADSDSSFYISYVGSNGSSGDVNDPTPPEDQPDGVGSLSGNVYEATGHGNDHVPRITVYLARSDGVFTGATAMTGEDSRFHFEGLAPGEYKLYFFDLAGAFEAVWYGAPAMPAGIPITVASGRDVYVMQQLNRADPEDGTISGRVKDATGNTIAGVDVLAYFVDEASGVHLELKGSAVTDAEGYYRITGLPPAASTSSGGGDSSVTGYKVQFAPSGNAYASQWYDGQPTYLTAKLIQLAPAEEVAGIDAVLNGGGTISGRITLEDGEAAPSTLVDIFDASGIIVDTQITGGNGTYQSDMLPVGTYHLRALPRSSEYSMEWYDNADDLLASADIQVLAGQDTGGTDLVLERVASTPAAVGSPSIGESESAAPLQGDVEPYGNETADETSGTAADVEGDGSDTAGESDDGEAADESDDSESSGEIDSGESADQTEICDADVYADRPAAFPTDALAGAQQ